MAIYQPSAIVGAISGAIGGVVFANSRGSKVVRHRPQKKRRATPARYPAARADAPISTVYWGNVGAGLTEIIQAWRDLGDQGQATWNALATQFPSTNRLGQTRARGGYQLFLQESLIWYAVFQQPRGVTVAGTRPPPVPSFAPIFFGENLLGFTIDDAATGEFGIVVCYVSFSFGPAPLAVPPSYKVAAAATIVSSSQDISVPFAWSTVQPALQAGNWCYSACRALGVSGQLSGPLTYRTDQVT